MLEERIVRDEGRSLHAARACEYEVEVGEHEDGNGDHEGYAQNGPHDEMVLIGVAQLLVRVLVIARGILIIDSNGVQAHGEARVGGSDEGRDQELKEELMVVEANAVSNPGAVVVHTQDTPAADGAVVGSGGLNLLAFFAVLKHHVVLKILIVLMPSEEAVEACMNQGLTLCRRDHSEVLVAFSAFISGEHQLRSCSLYWHVVHFDFRSSHYWLVFD
mmetsp:Transcript_18585/g.28541  ORF Transcript_18585/g.28541 Transcript_18585/m.28541 type:complete len:217 (-) Transcript_18585:595-1245(-)|eukprot:CAMPEP_0170497002 /NCGR_PEP_ID=MMETSP0208-20121228/23394_1 /TAXON_ID=197538 /ORGANISM="Strombidium inclinatum, Strain S3" /LENGTH=216 /DNA_ID=CAMNT_0010773679 /DNA_START=238 /DNA_END=888 /DNA_ORIENTATION=+